jgi:hypothetical protein
MPPYTPRPPRRRQALPWVIAGVVAVVLVAALGVGAVVGPKALNLLTGRAVTSQPDPSHALPKQAGEKVKPADSTLKAKYGYVKKLCSVLDLPALEKFADQAEYEPTQHYSRTDPVPTLGGSHLMDCTYRLKRDAANIENIQRLTLEVNVRVGYGPKASENVRDDYSVESGTRRVSGLGQKAVEKFGVDGADEGGRTLSSYTLTVLDSNLVVESKVGTTGSYSRNEIAKTDQQLVRELMKSLRVT